MSRPKGHVCFVCPYIEPYLDPGSGTHVGGAERQQYLLANRLREKGWEASFLSFEGGGRSRERIDGFDCWKTLPRTNDVRNAPRVVLRLLRTIRRVDADVFYVRGNPPLCVLASYCCRLLGEPLVYVVANDSNVEFDRLADHHGLFERPLARRAYRDAVRRADRVVAQTDHQRAQLEAAFGVEPTVIPNGYTLPDAAELAPADDREYVLWVGSLDPDQKRPGKLLALADRLPEVSFRMIGSTGDQAYEEHIADRAGTLPNVRFEGFVPPDEIDRHYREAVALVNTSAYEGFPNTFLEAWRFGVPVVSLEPVLDGTLEAAGIGIHAGSMDGLEREVSDLWRDRDGAARLGSAGRRHLGENYALDTVASAYEAVLGDATAATRRVEAR